MIKSSSLSSEFQALTLSVIQRKFYNKVSMISRKIVTFAQFSDSCREKENLPGQGRLQRVEKASQNLRQMAQTSLNPFFGAALLCQKTLLGRRSVPEGCMERPQTLCRESPAGGLPTDSSLPGQGRLQLGFYMAAASSFFVYGCSGALNTRSRGPDSTMTPSFITITWSHICQITSISWEMNR